MKERNVTIDIMKGIGIILMVVGHSGYPSFLRNFIYTFPMPLFFMISGYLITESKLNVIKKIKTLYWPFLFWSLFALALSYPLYISGIYNSPYNIHEYIIHLVKIITFTQPEPIVGPLWFLKSLFFSYIFVSIVISKSKGNKYQHYIIGLICFAMLCIGFILYKNRGWMIYNVQRELMIPWFIYLGYFIKTRFREKSLSFFYIVLFTIFLAVAGQYVTIKLIVSEIGNPIIVSIYSLIGFIIIYNISSNIQHVNYKFSRILAYIGRNTMPILILHVVCFKVVQIALSNLNYLNLGGINQIDLYYSPYWFLYSIIGIAMPLLLNFKTFKHIA